MNELKTLAFSVTATAMGVASSAADEPGKNGFFMDFSAVDTANGVTTTVGFKLDDSRPDTFRMTDYTADFSGVVRFGYGNGNFSTDLEFGVRSLDEEPFSTAPGGGGKIDVYIAMINAAMDFDPYDGVTPFFAFGVGSALGGGDSDSAGFTDITTIGHIDVGTRITLSPTADITFGYSFLVLPSNDSVPTPAHSLFVEFDYRF